MPATAVVKRRMPRSSRAARSTAGEARQRTLLRIDDRRLDSVENCRHLETNLSTRISVVPRVLDVGGPCMKSAGLITLKPAHVSLPEWRAIYHGAGVTLDPACAPAIGESARVVEAIVAKGEPAYGINTGFGKLASASITLADLAQLQRNIV